MKIQTIKQYITNSNLNNTNQNLDKSKMHSPISFKSHDNYCFSNPELTPLNIDKSSLPNNLNLNIENRFSYVNNIDGKIGNDDIYLIQDNNNFRGSYNNQPFAFNYNSPSFFSKTPCYTGNYKKENFKLNMVQINNSVFMMGNIGSKQIELEEIKRKVNNFNDFSHIKGTIGKDHIDITVSNYLPRDVRGKINNDKFAFLLGDTKSSGGTEIDSELFPIIFLLLNKDNTPPRIPDEIDQNKENMEWDIATYGG